MKEQDCPEPLRRYLDHATGRLLFRSAGLRLSDWTYLIVFGAGSIAMLVIAISSQAGRWRGFTAFAVLSALIAWVFVARYCDRTELEHADGVWLIQRWFLRWRYRPVQIHDTEVMTVFVRTTSSWPDFTEVRSLKIEFPALPFAGAPKPVEILRGYGIPSMDLAHLGKMFEDFAQPAKAK